ncbi:hypothetical protein [Pararhodobacter sp.]|uniref:hypothetical protein n=1 Tax=Pararhodobacter sp. TaxID=2127056 RepID=UPI002AFDDE05|nr:hypothetical protein [Pararhodobacter sp.]
MRRAAPILIASLLAAPALAFTPERAGIMVDAVRANGCTMAGSEAPGALEPLGLESVEVQTFVDVLFNAELVTLSEDMQTLSLSEALCASEGDAAMAMIVTAFEAGETDLRPWQPEFAPERGAALVAILRANDCTMTDQQAGEILPDQGFDPVITRDIVTLMLETDLATVSDDGQSVGLSPVLCAADPATDTATIAQALTAWTEANAVEESQ